jgi:hypothetical protein
MLALYRSILHLYPAAHRRQFGPEMLAVLDDLEADCGNERMLARIRLRFHESIGLLQGAFREHLRDLHVDHSWLSFPIRRFTMHHEFRFPKSTPILMSLILAGVVLAIDKGNTIASSLPYSHPQLGPIQPVHHTFFSGLAMLFGFFYAVGLIGWGILHFLHRSGVHRLAEVSVEPK